MKKENGETHQKFRSLPTGEFFPHGEKWTTS